MADQSIGIGKLFGIEIKLHWTFIMLLLLTLFLSTLPPPSLSLFAFIVILFTMVLLHELAHSLVSKHYKIAVKKIILVPLGGMSIIDFEGVEPRILARIAAAGPIASIVLAMVFGALYLYLPGGALGSFLELLFLINALLGIGNILPAFPLDGGKVLKNYYEEKYDQLEATKKTVKVSKAILVLYLVFSTAYVIALPNITASTFLLLMLWNIVIALFIYGGSRSELESAYVAKYAAKLLVKNAVTRDCIVVRPNTTLKQLYSILLKKGAKPVLFISRGAAYMVSDLASSPTAKKEERILSRRVSEFATAIPKIGLNESLPKAIDRMGYEESGVMAVIGNNKIMGMLLASHVEAIIALHMRSSKVDYRN